MTDWCLYAWKVPPESIKNTHSLKIRKTEAILMEHLSDWEVYERHKSLSSRCVWAIEELLSAPKRRSASEQDFQRAAIQMRSLVCIKRKTYPPPTEKKYLLDLACSKECNCFIRSSLVPNRKKPSPAFSITLAKMNLMSPLPPSTSGRGSPVVKVSDHGRPCHEFEPSTTKDPPYIAAMLAKSVES
ncbi:hypothetical protein TNCV_171001 [Trichonephila clavipes]|nr:hypothetical protein TNCV_171001 [Trichonephila clavipes]